MSTRIIRSTKVTAVDHYALTDNLSDGALGLLVRLLHAAEVGGDVEAPEGRPPWTANVAERSELVDAGYLHHDGVHWLVYDVPSPT